MALSPTMKGWKWSKKDASNPTLVAVLDNTSKALHIATAQDSDTDWNVAALSHPGVYIHSETTPATDYLLIGKHDGTTAYIDVVGGTTLQLAIAGTNEVNLTAAALSPSTSNGNALGTTALMWADLFLASGAVINFDNGNVTITHAAATLTIDGAAVVFNEASADLDFRIESNGNANMFMIDAGLDAIGIGGAATSGQTLTVTNAAVAATGRVLKLSATIAAAALTDGYGAFEVDVTLSGSPTNHSAASSSWVNITGGTVPAGTYICANNDGIYEEAAATVTNAKLIFGSRMQYIASDTDALKFPWSINTNNTAITALIDVNNISDLGVVANAGATTATVLPILRNAAGTLKYVLLYDLA